MNVIKSTEKYDSVNEVEYPKYSFIGVFPDSNSGFRLHIAHLQTGFGTAGATRQGIMGRMKELIKTAEEINIESLTFFWNCIGFIGKCGL